MAEFDVVAYLASKGLRGRKANGPEVTYPCFFDCQEPADSTKRKLYVNTTDGWYDCKVCGCKGGTHLLQKHFGDEPKNESAPGVDPSTRRSLLTEAAGVGATMLENNDDLLLWLMDERGLDPQTIIDRKLGFVGSGWSLAGSLKGKKPEPPTKAELGTTGLIYRDGPKGGKDFFWDHVLIPYISRGSVVQIRGRQNPAGNGKGAKYMTPAGEDVRFYNQDALDGADDVIITEGEFDAIVLTQHLQGASDDRARRIAVVGLAGTNAKPDNWLDYFENTKRIYIGFDSDEAGKREAEKLKDEIGPRARVLELPYNGSQKCDWSEFLLPEKAGADDAWRAKHPYTGHGWQDVMDVVASASGKRVFGMSEMGAAWRRQKAEMPEGWKTGFQQVDHTILPGLLPGQVMVVLAKTGTGKTVFLCNLAYNMRKQRILFLSLEMTREEVYDRLRRIYLFHNPAASDEMLEYAMSNIAVCDENKLSDQDFDDILSEYEVEMGGPPEVVFVDYLGYYARGQKGNSPYEKATNAIMQLKAGAKKGRYGLVTPGQVNRVAKEGKPIDLDDARDSGAIEETADFMFGLFRPDDALQTELANAQPTGKLKMATLKSRHGGKGRVFSFQMDLLSLAVVDDGTPAAKRAEQHNYLAYRGYTWDDMRAQELQEIARGTQDALFKKANS